MKNKLTILLLLTLFKVTPTFAQIDTAFWFAAPWVTPDHAARHPIKVHIATFAAPFTTVELRQPAAIAPNQYDTTIIIPANSVFDYTFWRDGAATNSNRGWDSLEVRPANQVVPYGLYFSSTSNISIAYDVITTGNNPETMSLKGQNGLGTEFVVPHQNQWQNQFRGDIANTPPGVFQPKQQINLVGTKPNTVVWITPKCNIIGHPANITYSILLVNPGDAYTLENTVQTTFVPGNNLSGTILSSNKPIAVTTADDSVRKPSGGCHDLIGDQIVPVEIVGKDYILNKGAMNAGALEGGYIVGTENFTSVQITNALSVVTNTIINKGQTYFYPVTTPMSYVQSDKSVYCYQADGIGCEAGSAILPPLSCAGSSLVAFSRNQPNLFYLNILCKNGAQNSFTINGSTTLIPGTAFTVVPGTAGQYVAAQVPLHSTATLHIGSYTVGNNTPSPLNDFALGIFDGSAGGGMNFYYMSSFLRRTFVTTGSITPVCASPNAVAVLTGTVSGGAITGVWTTSVGTGTIGSVYTSTLNTVTTNYSLSPADLLLPSIKFYLTSVGNCVPKTDSVVMLINKPPGVSGAVTPTLQCKNNVVPLTLAGTFSNAIGAVWTGGNGGSFGAPGANTTYTPSIADLAAGGATLVLSSQGPSVGCVNASATYTVGFVDPPTVSVLSSTIACTNSQSVAITGTVSGSNITYSWSTGNGQGFFSPSNTSLSTSYFFGGTDLLQSSIQITLTVIDNTALCSNVFDNMVINILPQPSLTLATQPTVCASAGVIALQGTVTGGGAGAITWSTTNGSGAFTPVPPTDANYLISLNDTLAGVNTLTFVAGSVGGFCPAVSNTITVTIIKLPFISVNTSTSVCQFAAITLSGSVSGYTNAGYWIAGGSVGGSSLNPGIPLNGGFFPNNSALGGIYYPSQSDIATGSVVITLNSASVTGINCPSNKSFTITFVPSPKADFSFSTKRCVGDPIGFVNISNPNGTNVTGANWNFGNGFTSIGNPSVITTYTAPGIYNISFTVHGTNTLTPPTACSDTISKIMSVNGLPNPDFSMANACVGIVAQLTNLSLPANGNFTWFFGPTATPSISSAQTPSNITFSQNGPISVDLKEVIAATQCSASVTKVVNVNAQPNAEFGMTNNPTVAQEPVYYSDFSTPTGSLVTWIWNFGDESSATGQSTTHNYQNGGIYYVTLTVIDDQGCTDTITKQIEVNLIPQVPTGFTPNGDGTNDKLFVKGGPFNKMKFRIYNNWGEKIYESDNQLEGWDGKKDGKDQPVGVYVWTLEVDLYNNRTVRKNGDVTLMR
ncbi:MAG: gliding motility-associated C-terminal domain-containing protein [Sphingobacteriaceae bacterium]|nr:gliding motility-associated C-terminal domain-containing protein [Sphingobacteriaceae bacterium]